MADTNMKNIPKVGCCFSSESHRSSEGCPADSGGALFAVKRGRDGRKGMLLGDRGEGEGRWDGSRIGLLSLSGAV